MSWRDRAIREEEAATVTAAAPASGGWRDRATAAEASAVPDDVLDVAVRSVSTRDIPAAPANESPRDMIRRLLSRAYSPEGFKMEDQLAMTPGRAGFGRFLEEEGKRVGEAVRESGMNLAEKFVEAPGVREFPEAAAGAGAMGSAAVDLFSDQLTPSSMAQNIAGEGVLSAAKGATRSLLSRGAENFSNLPPWLARFVKKSGPEVFERTAGTPESVDAAVGGLQDVINNARKEAGAKLEAVKESMGLNQTLEQKAAAIASGEAGRTPTFPEVIRRGMGALDPAAPKGPDSMANLIQIRQEADDLINFSRKGVTPVSSEQEAILKQLAAKINERLEGITAPTFERSAMGAASAVPGAPNPVGKTLRAAEGEFSRVADITEGLRPKFDTTPKAINTITRQMKEGLGSIDPDVKAIEDISGGADAMAKAKDEVARFLIETPDQPDPRGTGAIVARTLGLTPKVAAKFLAKFGSGSNAELAARYPGLYRAGIALNAAAARGPEALATTNFLLQQEDDEYRQTVQALQQEGKQ